MQWASQRFSFKQPLSPTTYNLKHHLRAQGWKQTSWPFLAAFGDVQLQFDEEAALCLEYKHLLAGLAARHCPEIMPLTFAIDDDNWPEVLQQASLTPGIWILKPSLLNNGESINIFESIAALEAHFLNPKRLGGMHVLQRYISQPHLLRDKRKYSIRLFVILTNDEGAWLYQQGYFNVALHPYSLDNCRDLRPHLTNEHLLGEEANVLQIPSQRFDHFKPHFVEIQNMLSRLLSGLKKEFSGAFQLKKQKNMALFGFDFMIENTGRVWLLEANHGPCFPIEAHHPLQHYLYDGFWKALIATFINQRPGQGPYSGFERLL